MTQLYGVIGHPVGHSLSPDMFNAAFFDYNMDARYERFDVEPDMLKDFLMTRLGRAGAPVSVPGVDDEPIFGLSVTIPHKEKIITFLNEVDEVAMEIGAVNTVERKKNGKLKGYNTDWIGAQRALEEAGPLEGKRVLVLGAGGAAAAIVYACRSAGAAVTVLNRTEDKAKLLADKFHCGYGVLSEIMNHAADVVVHTTSVGMTPHTGVSLVPPEYFKRGMVVMDIVYNPLETKLVRDARAAGCRIVPGHKMLLYQAEKQFDIWFRKKPPELKMEKALLEELNR
jgi:shikimate dehydrogenase